MSLAATGFGAVTGTVLSAVRLWKYLPVKFAIANSANQRPALILVP